MTTQKTLTPAEALRALADGKKLNKSSEEWYSNKFVVLKDGAIYNQSGLRCSIGDINGFSEYIEPKPKRKFAPYVVKDDDGDIFQSTSYYLDDDSVREVLTGVKIIRRVTELEVEIE